jgi:hypothetical protein
MPDNPHQQGEHDPQQQGQGQAGQGQGQGSQAEDHELTEYLMKEHGHTRQAAEQEVKTDREGVKAKKKQHEQQHGKSR